MAYQRYTVTHDPDSLEDYGRNWGDAPDGTTGWLREGEYIVTSEWTISSDQEAIPTLKPGGQGTGISEDKLMTVVYLEGGTAGITYKVTNSIISYENNLGNRKCTRTALLTCCER